MMIDPKLQAELRAKFNPDGSDLRKMQLRMLDMLKYIDKICRENNIKYWLSSGTCLGAVRHGGFIPWDDDVDIEMLEEDYKKICKILKSRDNGKYIFQDYSTDKEYTYTFAKLRDSGTIIHEPSGDDRWFNYQGCYIDIFPLAPSNSQKFAIFSAKLWRVSLVYLAKIQNKKIRRPLIKINHFLNSKIIFPLFSMIHSINNKGIYRHRLGIGFMGKRNINEITKFIRIKFEDTELPVPIEFDKYLTRLFGDYMRLPDLKSIHTHTHEIIFIDE